MINLNIYSDFVKGVTSGPSNNSDEFLHRIKDLAEGQDKVNISLLMTSAIGMSGETGEFSEIVKKMVFQGKPLTNETLEHASKELGDIIFYWTNACRSIGVDPNVVIQNNMNKLMSRYPGGVFNATHSENRKPTDI